ncbi:MAG: DDE-type integrase/transposase/recombinase [Deltaproteobacteria bacterium]|jgi:transposase InsO family protein|nr:DDE-type integrase/transposase/recombinase [Deltaproteobacteria bacterium]
MPVIRETIGASELAVLLGSYKRSVNRRALSEQWPTVPRQERGGGNLFVVKNLPPEVQKAILAADPEAALASSEPPAPDAEQITQNVGSINSASQEAKAVAIARKTLLDAWDEFSQGDSTVKNMEDFVLLYQRRLLPDLEPSVYEAQPSLSITRLKEFRRAFESQGVAGLLSRTHECGKRIKCVISRELALHLEAQISARPHVKPAALFEVAVACCKAHNLGKAPHRATIYRWVEKWKAEHSEEYTFMYDPAEWKNKYQPAHGSLSAMAKYAGQVWQMDSTPADVMTKEPDGTQRRCAIAAAIDVYSRRVVCTVAETSKAAVVAETIRRGIKAWGVPEKILMDNGKDYQSKWVASVVRSLAIKTPHLEAFKSEAKGNIERFFGTMCRSLAEQLPGYVGHSVEERAAIEERNHWALRVLKKSPDPATPTVPVEIPLSQDEFTQALNLWLKGYENRVHRGFEDDLDQSKRGLTPAQAFESSPRKADIIQNERLLDVLILKSYPGSIQKRGIRFNNGLYQSTAFFGLTQAKVEIKPDPTDAGLIYVYYQGKFLCVATDEALAGVRLEEYHKEKASHKKRLKDLSKARKMLGAAINRPFMENLATNELTSVDPEAEKETGGVVKFDGRAVFSSEGVEAAADTVAAIDGTPRPEAKVIDFPDHLPQTIWPKNLPAPAVDKWARWPEEYASAHDRELKIYEWYLEKDKQVGLTEADRNHMEMLWREHESLLELFYSRPQKVAEK